MSARRSLLAWLLLAQAAAQSPQEAASPAQLDAWRNDAFAAENDQRFSAAADLWLRLAAAEPQHVDWIVAAGRCLGRSGRFKEAAELLDGARARFPGVAAVPAMLARTLLLQAESDRGVLQPEVLWADAAELAESALAMTPDDEDSRLVLAQARYLLGDWQQAVAQAEEAVRRHPHRAGAHVLLGRIAGDRFRELLRRYEREQPTGQEAADLVAQIDAQRQACRQSYRRAAELDPTRAQPHLALGQIEWLDRRPDAAREHFAAALALDPDLPFDHDAALQGLDPLARAGFYRAIRERHAAGQKPRREGLATLRFHEGRARFDARQWTEAQQLFAAALTDNPAASNARWYLFLCAHELGDHDGAESHAAAYAAIGPQAFADVVRALPGERRGEVGALLQFLADRAWAAGRVDHSRELNHVLACLKDSADAWNNHAFLCRETGRHEQAYASYLHALEKEPDSPQLLNDAAVVLHYHLGTPENKTKARGMYARALRLAEQQLADPRVTGAARDRAQTARRDAAANLAELDR